MTDLPSINRHKKLDKGFFLIVSNIRSIRQEVLDGELFF